MRERSRLLPFVALPLLGLLLASCGSEDDVAQQRLAVISDQVHSGGTHGFFFLPPLVPQPTVSGTFDATRSPVVAIKELDASGGTARILAVFTTSGGPGSEPVQVDVMGQQYMVNWHTDQFVLDAQKTYRIQVNSGGQILGFADVDVVGTAREIRNVQTDEFVPLVNGRTLPVRFRIETTNWVAHAGASAFDPAGFGIAALPDGSSVVTGSFVGTAVFGAGEAGEVDLVDAGGGDIFVAKYDATGALAWAKRAGGVAAPGGFGDVGKSVAAMADGSVVVTGYFWDVATFGQGEPGEVTISSGGSGWDVFVARYNANGTLAWARSAGGASSGYDFGRGIAVSPDGCIFVTGQFSGTAVFGSGEPQQTSLVGNATSTTGIPEDMFLARYLPDGTLAWAKTWVAGPGGGLGWSVAAGPDGDAFLAGFFSDSTTLGSGEANETTLLPAAGSIRDIYVARYNSDGTLNWARRAGGALVQEAFGIAATSEGSILVTGYFGFGSATFGPGELGEVTLQSAGGNGDVFVARYNPDGTLAWAHRAGGTADEYGRAVAAAPDGGAFVTGNFSQTATFGVGEASETTLTAVGPIDMFVAKYNPSGTLAWAKRAGGTAATIEGHGVAAGADGSARVTGFFTDTVTFFPGESGETTRTAIGPLDVFVVRYPPIQTEPVWAKRAGGTGPPASAAWPSAPRPRARGRGRSAATATRASSDYRQTECADLWAPSPGVVKPCRCRQAMIVKQNGRRLQVEHHAQGAAADARRIGAG